jgi:two-component system chemotaxis response regulator CheY
MKKVMIVDDAQFMRMALRKMLENNEYEVVGEAENGQVAIKRYQELRPDIVTMDITMPEMDGVAAIRAIMNIDPQASILVVSAMGMQHHVIEAISSGAKGFVVKPLQEEFVVKALRKL